MLEQHFRRTLKNLGYPDDLKIEWSLGYCQGDGVAFYGRIGLDEIHALLQRLYGPQSCPGNAIARVKNLLMKKTFNDMFFVLSEFGDGAEVEITRNSSGNHYSHYNTMNLNSNVDFTWYLPDEASMEETGIQGLTEERLSEWQGIWDEFMEDLEEDIRSVSRRLQSEGYRLLEATPFEEEVVVERATENFIVRVTELPDYDFDLAHWDEDAASETIEAFLDGEARYVGLRAEVIDRETEDVIGVDEVWGLIVDKDDKFYHGYRRELVANAIQQARNASVEHPLERTTA